MDYLFIAKKIVSAIIQPPGLFIVLILVALFALRNIRNIPKTKWLLFITAAVLYFVSTAVGECVLLHPLEYAVPKTDFAQYDVVVQLGGGEYPDTAECDGIGSLGGDSAKRTLAAVAAARQEKVPIIITTGGIIERQSTESAVVEYYATRLGIAKDKIIIDDSAKDTADNARNVVEICKHYGYDKPLIVTSAAHMLRSKQLFTKQDAASTFEFSYLPVGYRTPRSYQFTWVDLLPDDLSSARSAWHEYLGLASGIIGLK